LSLTAGLDDIASRIGLDKLDRIIERGEILLRDDGDTSILELLLTERAVVFQSIGVRRAAHH
jgi:hypothetical protein